MKISLNWLKDYVALDYSNEEISRAITFLGFEVEHVITTGAPKLENVFVGEVLTRDKHPNADKLSVCTVDVGTAGGIKTIVCGAQNYKVGDRVPVALVGAVLPGNFTIKQSKIRGQLSDGMMCSAKELGVSEDAEGLLILSDKPALATPINSILAAADSVFDIEITPNRPDCLSHLGIARELAAWFKKPLNTPKSVEISYAGPTALLNEVSVENKDDCPLYLAQVVSGVKIGPSPNWIVERLTAAGIRPINTIVDLGNFVMLETGQPLHAFDAAKLNGAKLCVRRAKEGEKITTLDNKERTLTANMLVIADAARSVVIAGVMGGIDSSVSEHTTDVVIECAVFKPTLIRSTSRKLGLASDSSYRYERGVNQHTSRQALARMVELLVKVAGGKPVGETLSAGHTDEHKQEIVLSSAYVNERLGFEIPAAAMKQSLEALALTIISEKQIAESTFEWTVTIPSWRSDLERPIDLVEEILRLFGTESIPHSSAKASALAEEDDATVIYNRKATDYLVGHDFHECVNITLRPSKELTAWCSGEEVLPLALSNPFVEDQSHLRPSLIPGLVESLRLNQSRGVYASRLAETGRIFIPEKGVVTELASAAFLITDQKLRQWHNRESPDFYTAKHHTDVLASLAGVTLSAQNLRPDLVPGWQEGHSASAGSLAEGWVAHFGLLSVTVMKSLGIEGKVYAGFFAIKTDAIKSQATRRRFTAFSLQPAALRDLALVVDSSIHASEVKTNLTQAALLALTPAFNLESVDLFDVYQGQGVAEGKKSLAFSLVFRSPERTLTDDEVNLVFQKVQDHVVTHSGYSIRK